MNVTTFGLEFLKYVHPVTSRLHPNYRTHLNTARTATTNPNLLAIPTSHRTAFTTAHLNKRKLVVTDYSSQESRVLAAQSEDEALVDFFNHGHPIFGSDFHSYTSNTIYTTKYPDGDLTIVPKGHKDFTPEMNKMRTDAKTTGFSIPYGGTARSLSRSLGVTVEEAEGIIGDYFTAFPKVKEFLDRGRNDALNNGYFIMDSKLKSMFFQAGFHKIKEMEEEIQDIFFTQEYRDLSKEERVEFKEELYLEKPYLKENMSFLGKMKSSLGNKGQNYRIQALSAKQSKTALVRIREYAIENNMEDWLLCLLLHDEIISEAPDEITEEVLKQQKYFMKDSAELFCPNVVFDTDGGIEFAWEH